MFRREKDGNGRYLNCMSGFGVDGKRVRWDTRVGMIVFFVFLYSFLLFAGLSLHVSSFSWLRGWDLYDAVYLWLASMEDKDEKVFDLSLA